MLGLLHVLSNRALETVGSFKVVPVYYQADGVFMPKIVLLCALVVTMPDVYLQTYGNCILMILTSGVFACSGFFSNLLI